MDFEQLVAEISKLHVEDTAIYTLLDLNDKDRLSSPLSKNFDFRGLTDTYLWSRKAEVRSKISLLERQKMKLLFTASLDERRRFNDAVSSNHRYPILTTSSGKYEVTSVDDSWYYTCYPEGRPHSQFNQRTFLGCNDRDWENLLQQIGLSRHPYFRE